MKYIVSDLKTFALQILTKLGSSNLHQSQDEEKAQPAEARCHCLDWPKLLVVFCSTSAIEMALLSAQIHSELPLIFSFLGLSIIVSFTCFFLCKPVYEFKFPMVAIVLERVGIFFGVTAIYIAITIPFPLWFKCVTCFIYILCWLVILFCSYLHSK